MLSELNVVGKWFQDELAEGWHFDELTFDQEAKGAFEKLDLDIKVYDHSARIDERGEGNHTYLPSHYFLYALKVQPLLTLLHKYINEFDTLKGELRTPVAVAELIRGPLRVHPVTDKLDAYSRANFYDVFSDKDKRLNGKDIINGVGTSTKLRSNSDFARSIILKALPVPDASSGMLGKLIYSFSQSSAALRVLEKKYYGKIPYLFKSDFGDDMMFRIMSTLGWQGKLDSLFDVTVSMADTIAWGSIDNAFRLNSTSVSGNHLYLDNPIHYSESQGKYIHIRKGLLDDELSLKKVSTQLFSMWPELSIQTEGSTFLFKSPARKVANGPRLEGGSNKIIYGAPGTGKSHSIREETEKENTRKVVTVFHPDTQYSDFVGSLKPQTERDENAKPIITYQYRPGPFTQALIEAVNNPSDKVFLVIEEINRAPAAAVFGEIFQLLDRSPNGASTYGIDTADPDMFEYICANTNSDVTELKLPSNLYIYATMNSSDQAVMPLDTAFKRRWSFEYIKIDFSNEEVPQQTLELLTSDGLYHISWKDFANEIINPMLKEFRVPEDRLVGPFFLDKTELIDWASARSSLCGKLFVYLWDDVLRHKLQDRKRLFKEDITTYGDLFDRFMQDNPSKSIFADEADALVREHGEKFESPDA